MSTARTVELDSVGATSASPDNRYSAWGYWSFMGTLALLSGLGWYFGSFSTTLRELGWIFTGAVNQIEGNGRDLLAIGTIICILVPLSTLGSVLAGLIQWSVHGLPERHAVRDIFASEEEKPIFKTIFLTVLVEELVARWLFIGVLGNLWPGEVGFYVLFLLGNGLFALAHLSNYKKKSDRSLLRVLPQFVSGVFYTYAYLKFGLLGALLVHFGDNAVLFAMMKVQRVNWKDFAIIAVSALYAVVGYSMMTHSFGDLRAWFQKTPTFALEGWRWSDYLIAEISVSGAIGAIASLLLFDRGNRERSDVVKKIGVAGTILAATLLLPLVLSALYWALGFLVEDAGLRLVILSIYFCFAKKARGGSAVSRTFWISVPSLYILLCAIQALPFWDGVGLVVVSSLLMMPITLLTYMDD